MVVMLHNSDLSKKSLFIFLGQEDPLEEKMKTAHKESDMTEQLNTQHCLYVGEFYII